MIPEKRNWTSYLRLCLVGILCPLLLLLSIGTAMGRYRKTEMWEVAFQPTIHQQIFLWDGAVEDTETLQTLEGWTETEPGKAVLSFQVSNGTADSFCSNPLRFCIRIVASQGIQNPENLQIKLQIGEKEYTAKATKILEGSARFETFGPGWIYGFYDSNETELTWELLEGRLSKVNAVLTVEGVGGYTSLLRMEVTGFQGT